MAGKGEPKLISDPEDGYDEPILSAAKECESNFTTSLKFMESNQPSREDFLRKFQAKFLDWAAYLGVFAEKGASLDHRLKRHQQYRDLVLLLLDTLNSCLIQSKPDAIAFLTPAAYQVLATAELSDTESDESSDDEIDPRQVELNGIQNSIKELDRLAIYIRQSSITSLDARVKAFGARKLADVAPFEALATNVVESLYADASGILHERLSKSMTQRYTRLLYWRSHDKKLRVDRRRWDRSPDSSVKEELNTTNARDASAAESQHQQQRSNMSSALDHPDSETIRRGTDLSRISETIPSNTGSHLALPPAEGQMQRTGRGTGTTVLRSGAKFPPAPELEPGEEHKACIYCRRNIPKDSLEDAKLWRSQGPMTAAAEQSNSQNVKLPFDQTETVLIEPSHSSNAKKSVRFDATIRESKPADESPTSTTASEAGEIVSQKATNTAMLNHIADHLQFLALLTPRLSTEKFREGKVQDTSSSRAISSDGSHGKRSTLEEELETLEVNSFSLNQNTPIEPGADNEAKGEDDRTRALLWAAENGHNMMVRDLLEKGANVEADDPCERRSVSLAAMNGHELSVTFLLDFGAMLEAKDEDGQTALSWAAMNGHTAVATIESHFSFMSANISRRLVEYAIENPRVFLTLVITKLIKKMPLLDSGSFRDNHLPVRFQYDEGAIMRVYSVADDENHPWQCFVEGEDESSSWDFADIKQFVMNQWLFSAVIFENNRFRYKIHRDCPLPYTTLTQATAAVGHFGKVFRLGLQPDHTRSISTMHFPPVSINSTSPREVAVKQLRIDGASDEELTRFFDKETSILETMRKLKHPHLIEAILVYEKGPDRCFVFPWAQGGNLRQFWDFNTDPSDQQVIQWAWHQIRGLASGLSSLHSEGTRHGDVKPENILIFFDENLPRLGQLVISDVGAAKFHADETRTRYVEGEATTNRIGTLRYEPPEIEHPQGYKLVIISRKYDSWSLGCVLFEFIIWLSFGLQSPDLTDSGIKIRIGYRYCIL
ncbi:hypothetical protein SLS63_010513 [Diaporthe eres]|uniref:Protein kinase domain-containing protein n=1 Tax=Diaporthe eres TaxID=83184 RepID=A0ABR1NWT4_DIAER